MFRFIGTLALLCSLLPGGAQTAAAHDRVYDTHDSQIHYRAGIYRDMHMPRWLRHKKGFRRWYYRSSLRYNHHLAWWQLYEIYRWERRYDRRHHGPHYGARHRDYDWYRRYWRGYEHDRRVRRHTSRDDMRREWRDGTRRRHRHDD